MVPVARAREKAFQLLADDLVKEGLLRLMPLVLGHEVPDRDRRGALRRSECRPVNRQGAAASCRGANGMLACRRNAMSIVGIFAAALLLLVSPYAVCLAGAETLEKAWTAVLSG